MKLCHTNHSSPFFETHWIIQKANLPNKH